MKYLIDTHIAIWFVQGDRKLSEKSKKVLSNSKNEIFYSVVSLWEISIKININKLKLTDNFSTFREYLEILKFNKLKLENSHLDEYTRLELNANHRDPFDRMLIAQAITEKIPIISADKKFDLYPQIERIW